ncbi:MAG: hypothetical protein HOO96_35835, partial [Polyangiaceae bacterium]|nr:hypothetical protein [Polyangiaceae bacterium]
LVAEDEAEGRQVQGPGVPRGMDPRDPRWISDDCIEPPPLGNGGLTRDWPAAEVSAAAACVARGSAAHANPHPRGSRDAADQAR